MASSLYFLILSAAVVTSSAQIQTTTTTEEPVATTPGSDGLSWECSHPGLMCTDCETLSLCLSTPAGFTTTTVDNCQADETCSHSAQSCSSKAGPCQGAPLFTCHSEGYFPDPYDCNVYYQCGPISGTEYPFDEQIFCPSGTAYNSLTQDCTLSMEEAICKGTPVPACNATFSAGPLEGNSNFYYTCSSGNPKLYQCPEGQLFYSDLLQCDLPRSTTIGPPFNCPGTGSYEDPNDCHRYWDCSDVSNPKHETCFLGFYFDPRKQRCLLGTC